MTFSKISASSLRAILEYTRGRERAILRLLRELVEIESPSNDKAAVDRCGARVAKEWRKRGGDVRILRNAKRGDIVRAEISPASHAPASRAHAKVRGQIMILGHLDTVYPIGTLAKMPFRISGGRAWGPATFDMKGGLALALFAVDALRATRVPFGRKLVFLWTGDEEIGSVAARDCCRGAAKRFRAGPRAAVWD